MEIDSNGQPVPFHVDLRKRRSSRPPSSVVTQTAMETTNFRPIHRLSLPRTEEMAKTLIKMGGNVHRKTNSFPKSFSLLQSSPALSTCQIDISSESINHRTVSVLYSPWQKCLQQAIPSSVVQSRRRLLYRIIGRWMALSAWLLSS